MITAITNLCIFVALMAALFMTPVFAQNNKNNSISSQTKAGQGAVVSESKSTGNKSDAEKTLSMDDFVTSKLVSPND